MVRQLNDVCKCFLGLMRYRGLLKQSTDHILKQFGTGQISNIPLFMDSVVYHKRWDVYTKLNEMGHQPTLWWLRCKECGKK